MKSVITLAMVAALFTAPAFAKDAAHDHAEKAAAVTVTGEVLDLSCYFAHDGKGQKHQKCAEICIKNDAAPIGLLTQDGRVYLLAGSHAEKDAYLSLRNKAAETVTVFGDLSQKGGLEALVVKGIK